jgi:PPOX class probable F420-dependent enzyme
MRQDDARRRLGEARVAALATVGPDGAPHLVPITFALDGSVVWSAVDGKPKRAGELRRHTNLRSNPKATLLVHDWDEDWSQLWWVRADGTATMRDDNGALARASELLREKYGQYAVVALYPPVIRMAVEHLSGWEAR